MNNSGNLFFILFKQITLYIKEIERLNIIILALKKDQESTNKLEYFIQKREMDFENKMNIINALRYSKDDLEKKVNNLMVSENNLKKENMRLIKENQFYKNSSNSYSNTNIMNNNINNISHVYDNDKKKAKEELYLNKKYITNSNFVNNNNRKTNYNDNNLANNSISNKKVIKISKESNKIYKNNEMDSKSIIISVKRDEHLLLKGHRRNYSDQIGIGVLNQDNINLNINNNPNGSKKIIKNNNTIKINKNNIISFGVSTPKNKPIQIKNTQLSGVKISQNTKYKNNKSIKNEKDKKMLSKKKTDNITNKSKHIDFRVNNEKNNSLMKCSSLVFKKSNLYGQFNWNTLINMTENNYDFLIDNEIDDLSMMENLLNNVKDYINSNIYSNNEYTHSTPNVKK